MKKLSTLFFSLLTGAMVCAYAASPLHRPDNAGIVPLYSTDGAICRDASAQYGRQAAPKADAATWKAYKNFDVYHKVNGEWVLMQASKYTHDENGNVIHASHMLRYGNDYESLLTQYQVYDYELDDKGHVVKESVSMGAAEDDLTPARVTYRTFEPTLPEYQITNSVDIEYFLEGAWTERIPQETRAIERDAQGRIVKILVNLRSKIGNPEYYVNVPLTNKQSIEITYDTDSHPTEVLFKSTGYISDEHDIPYEEYIYSESFKELSWHRFSQEDAVNIYSLVSVQYNAPFPSNTSIARHIKEYRSGNNYSEESYADIEIEGNIVSTTCVSDYNKNYTRNMEDPAKPNEIQRYEETYFKEPGTDSPWWRMSTYSSLSRTFEGYNLIETSKAIGGTTDNYILSHSEYNLTFEPETGYVSEYEQTIRDSEPLTSILSDDDVAAFFGQPSYQWPSLQAQDTDGLQKHHYYNWFTGTNSIIQTEQDATDAPVEYFTIDGRRVVSPSGGIFLRRQGSRVEKVAIR